MSAAVIDGKRLAGEIRRDVMRRVEALKAKGREVRLDALLVGADSAGELYARNQATSCAEVGIAYVLHRVREGASYEEVAGRVLLMNTDERISAIMVHLPLPTGVDTERIQALIDPEKDVEGVNPANIGRVVYGRRSLVPCTALAVLEMVEATGITLRGARCVCVGASNIVGKPVAILLMQAEATLISTNKHTRDLASDTRQADVLISAAGVPGLIRGSMVKQGAVVIDVGICRVKGPDGKTRTVGDVAFDEVARVASHISPVPGGVGPVTVATMLRNAVEAAER